MALAPNQAWELTFNSLSQQSNIRLLPLKTLLVQLELRGIIESRYAYYAEYRFKYLKSPEEILANFTGERLQFVEAILRCASQAKIWCTLDFDLLYQTYQAERSRVVTALDYFSEKGWIELETKQMTEVYNVLVPDFDATALSLELVSYFQDKEISEIKRIHAMLALFGSDRCLSQQLALYFADAEAPPECGHCSVCHGQIAKLPKPALLADLADQNFEALCGEVIDRYQALNQSQIRQRK